MLTILKFSLYCKYSYLQWAIRYISIVKMKINAYNFPINWIRIRTLNYILRSKSQFIFFQSTPWMKWKTIFITLQTMLNAVYLKYLSILVHLYRRSLAGYFEFSKLEQHFSIESSNKKLHMAKNIPSIPWIILLFTSKIRKHYRSSAALLAGSRESARLRKLGV